MLDKAHVFQKNAHLCYTIVGKKGAGKSYFAKKILLRLVRRDIVTIVFDLNSDYIEALDEYLLYGMEPPKLNNKPALKEIVVDLERSRPHVYSTIVSALLDLDHEHRQNLLDRIRNTTSKTLEDGKTHTTTYTT